MKIIVFCSIFFVLALIEDSHGELRNINLHGYGTGTINADPLELDFMGVPVTLGGKGQGDIKGAMAVDIPSSSGLKNHFTKVNGEYVPHRRGFYSHYPKWLKHHSRHALGASVYGIKGLRDIEEPEYTILDDGDISSSSEEDIFPIRRGKGNRHSYSSGNGHRYSHSSHTGDRYSSHSNSHSIKPLKIEGHGAHKRSQSPESAMYLLPMHTS